MGILFSKSKNSNEEKQTLDKIMELSMTDNINNTDNFFILDYNSITTKSFASKTNYSDLLNTTTISDNILENSNSNNDIDNSKMSTIVLSNSLSEWNTVMDLSKTIL